MKYYFVTGNEGKYKEIKDYFPKLEKLSIKDLPEIQSMNINEIIREKLLKAADNYNGTDAKLIVEDTGLYLEALNNFPGPFIKFLLQSIGNKGIYKLCVNMGNLDAYSITVFGLIITSTKEISFFQGIVSGIISKPKGEFGFGWDQIFIPDGSNKTFAEMETIEEKNKYSMRKIGIYKLVKSGILDDK